MTTLIDADPIVNATAVYQEAFIQAGDDAFTYESFALWLVKTHPLAAAAFIAMICRAHSAAVKEQIALALSAHQG